MYSYFSIDKGIINCRVCEVASKFLDTLNSLINYNDGQGRKFDILDSELE